MNEKDQRLLDVLYNVEHALKKLHNSINKCTPLRNTMYLDDVTAACAALKEELNQHTPTEATVEDYLQSERKL